MDFSKIATMGLDALEEYAPTLAGMIGGPLAGTAVSAIEGVLGLQPTGNATAALTAVASANPDQILALQAENNRHEEVLSKAGIDLESIAAKDRDSARQREMAVKDWMPGILGGVTVFAFFSMATYILAVGLNFSPETSALVGTVIGYASAKADLVLAYYFGSSKGADASTKLAQSLVK